MINKALFYLTTTTVVNNKTTKDKKTYTILGYKMITERPSNGYHPTAGAKMKYAELTLNVPAGDDFEFYNWFYKHQERSGTIHFLPSLTGSTTDEKDRDITFTSAVCIGLKEYYVKDNNKLRQLTVRISMLDMQIYDLTFTKK